MQKFSFILNQYNNQKSSTLGFAKNKQSSFFRPLIQPKLTINQPNNVYEQEAGASADKVMCMPDPSTGNNLFFKPTITSIQRKSAHCEEEEKKAQRKENGSEESIASAQTEDFVNSLSGGRALNEKERSFFEPRMGYDFGNVRLHTDNAADQSAKNINALAYTQGNNIVFRAGQYQTGTNAGKRLLAHELTHVVQQHGAINSIQRTITIGGTPMKVDKTYLDTVNKTFGPAAVTIAEKMDNKGAPPDFAFDSWNSFSTELRIRTNAIKGMEQVHAGCCNYPSTEPDGFLNPTFWKRNARMDFTLKMPLPSGKEPSDAIESIFAPGAGTQLECLTMTIAIEYYSLLKGMGKDKFDKKFKGGTELLISTRSLARGGDVVDKEYDNITATKADLLPGDWVYFKNFIDYTAKHPGGFWRGENAIVMGAGLYRGFGITSNLTEAQMNEELVKAYNTGLPAVEHKTVTDLLGQGGGLKSSPVYRLNTKKLLK